MSEQSDQSLDSKEDLLMSKQSKIGNSNKNSEIKKIKKTEAKVLEMYENLMKGKPCQETDNVLIRKFFKIGVPSHGYVVNETDLHIGDLVIQFPNPDHPKVMEENAGIIKPKESKKLFKMSFPSQAQSKIEMEDYKLLEQAFRKVFKTLEPRRVAEIRRKRWELESKGLDTAIAEALVEEDRQKTQSSSLSKAPQFSSLGKKKGGKGKKKKEKKKQKTIVGGSFFYSRLESNAINWYRTSQETNDFMTLIRLIIQIKLARSGFHQRMFLSSDHESIFLVIYSEDENLKITASNDKMQKELDFGLSDM